VILLYLNNRASLVDTNIRNGWKGNATLVIALALFLYAGWLAIQERQ
jgi:hypothetical protein